MKIILRTNNQARKSRHNWNDSVSKVFWTYGANSMYTHPQRSRCWSWKHEQSSWENGIRHSYKYPIGVNGI